MSVIKKVLIRISGLLKNVKKGINVEVCYHCNSKIGEKYSNEFYRLNNKIYCSLNCFDDNMKKVPEKNIVTKKKKGKKK